MGIPPIQEDRPLTSQEQTLVRWLLEHGSASAASLLSQLAEARVSSRCPCGCASVDFAIGGVEPRGPLAIVADFEYRSTKGHLFGAFVFERDGLLAGLEVYSMEGESTASTLPDISQLLPFAPD